MDNYTYFRIYFDYFIMLFIGTGMTGFFIYEFTHNFRILRKDGLSNGFIVFTKICACMYLAAYAYLCTMMYLPDLNNVIHKNYKTISCISTTNSGYDENRDESRIWCRYDNKEVEFTYFNQKNEIKKNSKITLYAYEHIGYAYIVSYEEIEEDK